MSDDNPIRSRHGSGFVVDGSERLADGVRGAIKKEVEAEFSERLAKAKWLEKLRLFRQIRSEINQRAATEIAKQMPSKEALW
ncbi:MAG: hypothetical protein KDA92_16375 [Planctomycetales bacterium]|nr:hypothetical protein [Planctomycetales bacterium]MCA9169432.1 hypothetical protein [Planctomycetales bacterium]